MSTVPGALEDALAGRYRVEREVGSGGMASVYLAEDLKHRRPVAIKVLDPALALEIGSDRFVREIELAARLTHPHILPLHDSGAAGDLLYYVMPYIRGESLHDRLAREERLPLAEALRLTREIGSALSYAHGQGVIHRDVKPDNILLLDGMALLMDFGIARPMDSDGAGRVTISGVTLGTPLYMSPEQVLGSSRLDARTDLYSLACVLYEMLTGQPPFGGSNLHAIQGRHLFEAVPSLEGFRPDVPAGVRKAIERGLAKAPADRHADVSAFLEALSAPDHGFGPPPTTPHRLPRAHTSFVGRARELTECRRLLGGTRLLTLTGVGGAGKTRLGIRVAELSLGGYPDGVWFVDLAPVTALDRLHDAVAGALGVSELPGEALIDTMTRQLAEHRALLVLDNCEHLLRACAELVETMLLRTQHLGVLATSRQLLGVSGEQNFPVPPLPLPSERDAHDIAALGRFDSIRLFAERAQLAWPDFALTAQTGAAVADICRCLDGIPFAIELAAARAKTLSMEQLRTMLGDRFRLLTGGGRTSQPHQQTLRATMQWSYDQLSPEEQRLLRSLGVFAGSWALDAARALAGDDADSFDVLDQLTGLVDKSLVEVLHAGRSEARYRLLETVREYALERLAEAGEEALVRERHGHYFCSFMEDMREKLRASSEQAIALARVDEERPNLMHALEWSRSGSDRAERGLKLVGALSIFWGHRGEYALGMRTTGQMLQADRERKGTLHRAIALQAWADFSERAGNHEPVNAALGEAMGIFRELGDLNGVASTLLSLGVIASTRGERDTARRCYLESQANYRAAGRPRGEALAFINLGVLSLRAGAWKEGETYLEEALATLRQVEDWDGVTGCLTNLSFVSLKQGDLPMTRARLTQALRHMREIGTRRALPDTLEICSALAVECDAAPLAGQLFGAAQSLREAQGIAVADDDRAEVEGIRDRIRGALGETRYVSAWDAGRELAPEVAADRALEWLETSAAR